MHPICCTRIFINVPWADIFKFDPNYLETEEKHKAIKTDISGEARLTMSQDQGRVIARTMTKVCLEDPYLTSFLLTHLLAVPEEEGIKDRTETNMINPRRLIYLAINYEAAVHKLLKVQLKEGEEV